MNSPRPQARVVASASWASSDPSDLHASADCKIVPARMRRATSVLTRGSVEIAHRLVSEAGWIGQPFGAVFGAAHGEIQIAMDQIRMMCEPPGLVSPARFKNSVHNTAAGFFSIVTAQTEFSTAIAAGNATVGACFLEALSVIATGEQSRVIVVVGEEPLPAPLRFASDHRALIAGIALEAVTRATDRSALAIVSDLRPAPAAKTAPAAQTAPAATTETAELDQVASPLTQLIDAITTKRWGRVPLTAQSPGLPPGQAWSVDLQAHTLQPLQSTAD